MRTLLLLSAVFSLLATYLEYSTCQSYAASTVHIASVVRDREPATLSKRDSQLPGAVLAQADNTAPLIQTRQVRTQAPVRVSHLPLNLQLPGVDAIHHSLDTGKSALINLFKRSTRGKVTYNAELVYDQETGEDITGGKVNIRIPLT